MRVTLAPLLTVLLSAAALFGFAAAHQDFAELEARHVPSSYLRRRDLSFSHEDFDARDGFNAEYEGLQERGVALEVPFQLSLRDFLEEAVEVYRRTGGPFTLLLGVGSPLVEQIPLTVTPQTPVRVLFEKARHSLGLSQKPDFANHIRLARGSEPNTPLIVRGDGSKDIDMSKTMEDLKITEKDFYVLATKKELEQWVPPRGSRTGRPLPTQANGSKKPAKAPAQTAAKPAQKK